MSNVKKQNLANMFLGAHILSDHMVPPSVSSRDYAISVTIPLRRVLSRGNLLPLRAMADLVILKVKRKQFVPFPRSEPRRAGKGQTIPHLFNLL